MYTHLTSTIVQNNFKNLHNCVKPPFFLLYEVEHTKVFCIISYLCQSDMYISDIGMSLDGSCLISTKYYYTVTIILCPEIVPKYHSKSQSE